MAGVRVTLLKQVTVDETTSVPVDCRGLSAITLYLFGHGTTSSGSITFEEADKDPSKTIDGYDGTWAAVGTAVAASGVTGGKVLATHFAAGAYGLIRARIDTVIGGGGSISVVLVGAP